MIGFFSYIGAPKKRLPEFGSEDISVVGWFYQ